MAKSISRYLADISSTSGVLDGTLSTAAQTNITSLGTLSSLTVSGAMNGTLSTAAQPNITSVGTLSTLAMGGSITRTGDLTLDASGKIILDADDPHIQIKDGGVLFGSIYASGSDLHIKSEIQDEDIIFQGNDGGSTITALTLDMSEAGTATFNFDVYIKKHLRLLTTDDQANDWVIYTHTDDSLRFNYNGSGNDEIILATTGALTLGAYTFPTSDGSNGQILKTNGSGTLSFADDGGKTTEEIQDIVGAMFTGNTETRGSLTYQDGDGTIDLVVDDMTAVTTINSNTNNYLITGTGTANTLQGESGLTFDGTTLAMSHAQLSHPTTYAYQTLQVLNTADTQACLDLARSNGSKVGTFYGDSSHNQGFLSSTYGWVFKVDNNGNAMPTASLGLAGGTNTGLSCELYHPNTSAWQTLGIKNNDDTAQCAIEMFSSQGTKRCIVYGATDYYGFLTQSAGWSWKGDSSGNWIATANITAYSDIRLKEKVSTIPNALEKVTKLRGVEYTRISTQEREIGVIAQEVKEVVPELVTITDGRTEADPDALQDLHTMKYQNTVGLLIEAIKELKAEVDELKGSK